MQHEHLVEAPMLDPAALALDVAIAHMDLRAWEKLASCLCVDWVAMMPGWLASEAVRPIAKRP